MTSRLSEIKARVAAASAGRSNLTRAEACWLVARVEALTEALRPWL